MIAILHTYSRNVHRKSTGESKEERIKSKKYTCEICAMDFDKQSDLSGHRYLHTDRKEFLCETCNRMFQTEQTLLWVSIVQCPSPKRVIFAMNNITTNNKRFNMIAGITLRDSMTCKCCAMLWIQKVATICTDEHAEKSKVRVWKLKKTQMRNWYIQFQQPGRPELSQATKWAPLQLLLKSLCVHQSNLCAFLISINSYMPKWRRNCEICNDDNEFDKIMRSKQCLTRIISRLKTRIYIHNKEYLIFESSFECLRAKSR